MTCIQKPLVRLAVVIHARLAARRPATRLAELPAERWLRCEMLFRTARRAELRGWQLAADQYRRDLRHAVRSLQAELVTLTERLGTSPADAPTTTVGDLYRDLVALHTEFEHVRFDHRAHTLSVATEPIDLDGLYLGAFEVRLDWHKLDSETCYRVVALEPRPAAARDGVTHPHVLDEMLCEGHGRHALRQALAQGRLLDFFTIVASLLRTYNGESAFVELSDWDGVACSDCGTSVSRDERSGCPRCGNIACDECVETCAGCEEVFCSGCVGPCEICDEARCRRCLDTCAGCSRTVCPPCLNDQERCPHCHEEESDDPDETNAAHEEPHPAVHADRVGQAPLSAGCG
jgi:hypothetical protein